MTKSSSSKTRPILVAILIGAVIIGAGLAIGLALGLRDDGDDKELTGACNNGQEPTSAFRSATKTFHYAAVAADSEIASDIGTDILARKRGNAVDATVAALFATGVMNPHSAGIGGGSFLTVYIKKTDEWFSYDFRETAPGFATRDMYVNQTEKSLRGGLAIGVPGEVEGLYELHQAFGSVPWKDLVMPTVRLCENGVPLTTAAFKALDRIDSDELKRDFSPYFDDNLNKKPVGSLIKLPELARTFQRIADDPHSFYNGTLADEIAADVQEAGGNITKEDLSNYRLKIDPPTKIDVHGNLTVYSTPAPGSGPVLSYILGILSGYAMSPDSISDLPSSVLTHHRIVEAMKYAFGKRTELGDENFVESAKQHANNMTSPDYGEATRLQIDDERTHPLSDYHPQFALQEDAGTTHLSVIDGEGNAVSVTSTINTYFGSKVRGSRTGIVFNNEMDDFSTPGTINYFGLPASEANFIEAGKRPMSSMCPAIVYDNANEKVVLITGAAGGTRITTATALNIIDVMWLGKSLPESVDRRRFHHQLVPEYLQLEEEYPQDIVDGLEAKGHKTGPMRGISVVQALHIQDDVITSISDFRKGGTPAGF